jgi:hypothetical protein
MKGITKPKGIGIAAILVVALLATTGLGYAGGVQPLVAQTVDITTKEVTLYKEVDLYPGNGDGEIYVKYSTNKPGDVDVTTGTQVVPVDGQPHNWYATPCHWTDQPYAANRIFDTINTHS